MNRWFLALLIFTLIVAILPVKSPWTITIIARGAPLVLLVIVDRGGCCNIFSILNNRLLSDPLCNLGCGLLGWVTIRASSLWPSLFLDISLLATLVATHIWLEIRPSSICTDISSAAALGVDLLQSFFDRLINGHSVCLHNWRLVLRLLLAGSQFLPLWIDNIVVFARSLLYKRLIGDELLWWY